MPIRYQPLPSITAPKVPQCKEYEGFLPIRYRPLPPLTSPNANNFKVFWPSVTVRYCPLPSVTTDDVPKCKEYEGFCPSVTIRYRPLPPLTSLNARNIKVFETPVTGTPFGLFNNKSHWGGVARTSDGALLTRTPCQTLSIAFPTWQHTGFQFSK